ncbi:MAG: hypothetical protein IAE97_12305 [Chthoniobacterales bacterium]|nr:hypothetical protein [Chthoniobacterales bacterium]
MPATFDVHPERKRVDVTLSGTMSVADLEQITMALHDSPGFDPSFDVFTDAREVRFVIEPKEVMEFADFYCKYLASTTGRSALLMSTPRETTLALIHKHAVRRRRTIEIFQTQEAALKWLEGP